MKTPTPITAHPEESVRGLGFAGERRVQWTILGKHADADAQRVLRLEACPYCLEVFPAPLKPGYEADWARALREMHRRPWPMIEKARLLELVASQICPTCKKPLSETVAEIEYEGPDEWAPGGRIYETRVENVLDQPLADKPIIDVVEESS